MRKTSFFSCWCLVLALTMALGSSLHAQLADVTQPGDPLTPSSGNSPGSEGVANAIDNQPTKYLNFDRLNTGFTVTPSVGLSVVQMLTLTSANDAPERDPADYTLEGSYDGTNFTLIASNTVPAFTNRFHKVAVAFSNNIPYLTYRLIFPNVVGPGGNSMQISEVELLGFLAPSDVTQPGDPIIPTSGNSPGSEGVANAIDNQPTKYLNFDRTNTGFTVTPSVGATLVKGITLTSANDAPERDPTSYLLEGSLDGTSFFTISSNSVPAFPTRFHKNYIFFDNARAYRAYRLIFPTVVDPGPCCMQISEVELLGVVSDLPQDVTLPGDPIVPSSANSPGSEGVANAIDNQPTKYLNFDRLNTGFTVSPAAGLTLVNGLTLTSANDAPERDPADYTLEGSYDGTNFTLIASNTVPAFTNRFHKVTAFFDNRIPYLAYRLTFPNVVGPGGNSMQISEVELLGNLAPSDVTVPGDPIVATSGNSPGSEGVANAIDNQPTKYLNFDRVNTGFTVTPGVGDTIVSGLTLTSANDAPERDPTSYLLSGSNDGQNYVEISSNSVPPFPTRFHKNYIFFADNTTSFKSYRLIFPTVVDPGPCCMQIAEVELLGVTPGVVNTNPVSTLVRRQPQDTPVLAGSRATFRVELTGPWRVQWQKNGTNIAGANTASFTTAPVTAADDGGLYRAVISSPQGMQTTDEVMLSVFTPSTTESIGLNWVGGGANGAPTEMFPDDITGFHAQAYWNNLAGGSGTLAEGAVTNSNNQLHPTIDFAWSTSGEWGAGTGEDDPTQRMLNGMTRFPDNSGGPEQTMTFTGVPAGSHSLLIYTVQVPLEFFNMDFSVVTFNVDGTDKAVQQRFIRPQNADEYNPTPQFFLVTSTNAANRSIGNMMRFDNLQTDDGRIQIRFTSPGRIRPAGTEPIRGPGVNGLQLLLNPGTVPQAPVIAQDPVGENAPTGGTVTLRAQASGPNLTYQWLKNGQPIAGATSATLTLGNLQASDEGKYSVIVGNTAGNVVSRVAVVDVLQTDSITESLILHLPFDDAGFATGTTVSNSVAGGQPGRVFPDGTFIDAVPGPINNGLALNGTDQFVVVSNYTKPTNAMTISGWVFANAEQGGAIVRNWLQSNPTGSRGQFFIDLNVPATGAEIRSSIGVGPNEPVVAGPVTNVAGQWHHFAMTANASTESLYWDGQLIESLDYAGNLNNNPAIPWLAIGFNGDMATPGELWQGGMDDLALWGRSLSGAEIRSIYNGGLAGQSVRQVRPVSAPFLTIARSGNNVTVTWSQNVTGYILESTTSLNSANPTWTTVTGAANNQYSEAAAAGGTKFFRLRQQQ